MAGTDAVESGAALGDQEVLGVVAALVSAAISANAMLLVRKLVQTERTATIVLWFSVTASVMSLLSLPFGWQALTPAAGGVYWSPPAFAAGWRRS